MIQTEFITLCQIWMNMMEHLLKSKVIMNHTQILVDLSYNRYEIWYKLFLSHQLSSDAGIIKVREFSQDTIPSSEVCLQHFSKVTVDCKLLLSQCSSAIEIWMKTRASSLTFTSFTQHSYFQKNSLKNFCKMFLKNTVHKNFQASFSDPVSYWMDNRSCVMTAQSL